MHRFAPRFGGGTLLECLAHLLFPFAQVACYDINQTSSGDPYYVAVVNFHCKSFKKLTGVQGKFMAKAMELAALLVPVEGGEPVKEAVLVGDMNLEAPWPKGTNPEEQRKVRGVVCERACAHSCIPTPVCICVCVRARAWPPSTPAPIRSSMMFVPLAPPYITDGVGGGAIHDPRGEPGEHGPVWRGVG